MYLANNELIAEISNFSLNSVTAELREKFDKFTAGIAQNESLNSRVLSVSGSSAEIFVCGLLTKNMTFMTWMMGGTAYTEIISAAQAVDADPEIEEVIFRLDSGGGGVSGMISCANAIAAISKKTIAIIDGTCASACYLLAAQCDEIIAESDGEIIGSIGAQGVYGSDDEGRTTIRGTNSFNKNPDTSTGAGEVAAKAEVDQFESVYIEAIAAGRGITKEQVIESYGNGAIMNSKTALSRGMIDSIKTNLNGQGDPDISKTAKTGDLSMKTIAELKANHPELYAQAVAIGDQQGKTKEQERVSAFAELGAASGASDLAMECIKDGTEHSATVNAKFMAAQMKSLSLDAMAKDNPDTSGIDTSKAKAEDEVSAVEQAALDVAADMGVEV